MRLKINRGEGRSAERTTRNPIVRVPHGSDANLVAAQSFCGVGACRVEGPREPYPISQYLPAVNTQTTPRTYRTASMSEAPERLLEHGHASRGSACDTGFWGSNCTGAGLQLRKACSMLYALYVSAAPVQWSGAEFRLLGPHISSSSYSAKASYLSSLPAAASLCVGESSPRREFV